MPARKVVAYCYSTIFSTRSTCKKRRKELRKEKWWGGGGEMNMEKKKNQTSLGLNH